MTALRAPIVYDSVNGSNDKSSGLGPAGPGNPQGLNASTSGTTVTVSGDTPDLSGVQVGDLAFVDVATGLKYSPIASINGNISFDVDDTLPTESNVRWAVGGTLQSISGTPDTRNLFESSIRGGWIVEFVSGYTETVPNSEGLFSSALSGDLDNRISVRSQPGFTVRPNFETDFNGPLCVVEDYWCIEELSFQTIRTGQAPRGIDVKGRGCVIRGNFFDGTAALQRFAPAVVIEGESCQCYLNSVDGRGSSTAGGLQTSGSGANYVSIFQNVMVGCDAWGISLAKNRFGAIVAGNVIASCGTGILTPVGNGRFRTIIGNQIYDSGVDAILCDDDSGTGFNFSGFIASNNTIQGATGVGIRFTLAGAAITDPEVVRSAGAIVSRNGYRSVTPTSPANLDLEAIEGTADFFEDPGNFNFNINALAGGGQKLRDEVITLIQ